MIRNEIWSQVSAEAAAGREPGIWDVVVFISTVGAVIVICRRRMRRCVWGSHAYRYTWWWRL